MNKFLFYLVFILINMSSSFAQTWQVQLDIVSPHLVVGRDIIPLLESEVMIDGRYKNGQLDNSPLETKHDIFYVDKGEIILKLGRANGTDVVHSLKIPTIKDAQFLVSLEIDSGFGYVEINGRGVGRPHLILRKAVYADLRIENIHHLLSEDKKREIQTSLLINQRCKQDNRTEALPRDLVKDFFLKFLVL